ncbi:hypothetical protein BDQ12DRAFT_633361 [Crucibulum laeve]|uniref:RFX-type winged-helix domain-containing protein n=1 Tax=Crucibulum laeve TaxID=68775 RepID=A0A5C3LWP3_9AGAR|nr:hypothetical protein BDQ12DRAFT_633361 [Crucibulum laeve]
MSTFVNQIPGAYYRHNAHVPPARPRTQITDTRDDYERWYTETVPSNRMSLSLRSGIHSEIAWALERLCRLCHNEQFVFSSIPGLIDGLFDWPEWYATEGYKKANDDHVIFSPPPEYARQRRYALESLFVLRNAALHDQNARELLRHSHTMPLISNSLHNLDFLKDDNAEFLLHIIEVFQIVTANLIVSATTLPPSLLPPLVRIASNSSNRTMIIASLTALTAVLSNPANAIHLQTCSAALEAAIRYLPLFIDHALIDACVNYLYCHVSYPPMARAFLLHPSMPNVLKLLVSLLLHEQTQLEDKVMFDVTAPIYSVPSTTMAQRVHELTKEELDNLLDKPEPQRCYDWMKIMFVPKVDGELTQVDFWNLYKDAFMAYQDQYPLLVASDVIKNVNFVFPQAQAMVLQGPVQRFVVRGVDRRKEMTANERFKCQWDRRQCPAPVFSGAGDMYDHILEHIHASEKSEVPCLWATCSRDQISKQDLRTHVLTHISSAQPPEKHPSQSDTITLPSASSPYPVNNPTTRPPPPPRSTIISYKVPTIDPPSTSLTALLIIRVLFRTSFASAEVAPKVDADHFGFPGIVEDTGDSEQVELRDSGTSASEHEGESRGRKAFTGIRKMLEGVRIKDEVLMSWVTEMIDAGISGSI